MRAVLQRVTRAEVVVNGEVVGRIGTGLCVFVGVENGDVLRDAEWLAGKVARARLFIDDAGKMNRDVSEALGSVLAVSQFTLLGDLRRGSRPSFGDAMAPDEARGLFDAFCGQVRGLGVPVETGRFREHMDVSLDNDGPVTLLLDSKKRF